MDSVGIPGLYGDISFKDFSTHKILVELEASMRGKILSSALAVANRLLIVRKVNATLS